MSELQIVRGSDCLEYINKDIGFGSREDVINTPIEDIATDKSLGLYSSTETYNDIIVTGIYAGTRLARMTHDLSKRIIGLVTKRYDDGGLRVALLGTELITGPANFKISNSSIRYTAGWNYIKFPPFEQWHRYDANGVLGSYPPYDDLDIFPITTMSYCNIHEDGENGTRYVGFDDAIDYIPVFTNGYRSLSQIWRYQGNNPSSYGYTSFQLTNDKNNTLVFGQGLDTTCIYDPVLKGNPLSVLCGNLYDFMCDLNLRAMASFPNQFANTFDFEHAHYSDAYMCEDFNLCAIPFNIILTENEEFALQYLSHGTVPPDAFLYPLDWDNLPSYEPSDTEINPDDEPNDNTPDDNSRDITPNLPVVPTFTPSMLSNYNWYWLTVPDYSAFIDWFWNDIGDYNDFDDLIAKVKGLYNDVASAVLMVRYFPVDISWIGGLGTQAPIKLGMIEKSGSVDTISQATPPAVRDIGSILIPKKYKSFCDLAPYSQLSLYLPYHGFVDLDVDILVGHTLNVKGVYDYLTGTLQYYLYCDNAMLINSFIVKLAVDIPITLQTKNDRDSAVFSNVSNAVAGLVGAGSALATGNPVGLLVGANAINNTMASAPLNVKGTVGETGALYGPPQCAIILRRPTIQSSDKGSSLDTWRHNVGQLCGYGYTLSGLTGAGFTVCHTPRINFTKTTPYQTEVDEIYDYLSKGVIL